MKVLVVEDDADLRVEIVEYLERRRHEVTGCGTLAAARDVVESRPSIAPFEAAICDVGLPDGDGLGFFLDNVARQPDCRWILMSGSHDLGRLREALQGRSARPVILEKPTPLRTLNDALEGRPVPNNLDPDR